MKIKNWWSHIKHYINAENFTRAAIVVIAVALIFIIVVILKPAWFPQFPMVRETVSATSTAAMVLATLVLAYATFRMIRNSNKLEQQRRKDVQVTEIIKWAEDIGTCILQIGTPQDEKQVRKVITTDSMAGLYLESRLDIAEKLMPLRMRSVYIKEVSKNDPAVQKYVEASIEHLRSKLRLSYRYRENKEKILQKGGFIKAAINLAKNEYELYDSIVELMETNR